mgnify:CR=1 FL=1
MMRFFSEEEHRLMDITAPWIRAKLVDGDIEVYLDPEAPEEVKRAYKRRKEIEPPRLIGFG